MTITPTQLATELRVDPKDIRKILRERYGVQHQRWELDAGQELWVRNHIRPGPAIPRDPLLAQRLSTNHPPILSDSFLSEYPTWVPKLFSLASLTALKEFHDHPQQVGVRVGSDGKVIPFCNLSNISRRPKGIRRRGNGLDSPVPSEGAILSDGSIILGLHATADVHPRVVQFKSSLSVGLDPKFSMSNLAQCCAHKDYLRTLSSWTHIPQWMWHLVLPPACYSQDNPTELATRGLSSLLSQNLKFSTLLELSTKSGYSVNDLTLRDLCRTSLNSLGELPQVSIPSYIYANRYGYSNDEESSTLGTITRYLNTVGVLNIEDINSPLLDVTISYLYQKFYSSIKNRAKGLLEEVMAKYGFKADEGRTRIKSTRGGVTISEDLSTHIGGKFCCIVPEKNWGLPHEDNMVVKILAVCTSLRYKISTITGEMMNVLEREFPVEDKYRELAKSRREE